MTYNNRLEATLANNIKLDANVEYNAERLCGGNMIWLVNRPAGVKVYINAISDRSSAMVLNEANRGYKWKDIGQYGDLKQYDNFYLWTEGVNISEKLELQISPNAEILEPILGNTADKIDKIAEIGGFSTQALIDLNNAINNYNSFLNNDGKILEIVDTGKISYRTNEVDRQFRFLHFLTPTGRIADLELNDLEYYRVNLFGHIDIGNVGEEESIEETAMQTTLSENCHLSLFNNENNAILTPDITQDEIENLYTLDKPTDSALSKFDLLGLKYFYESIGTNTYETSDRFIYFNGQNQINFNRIFKGSHLNTYDYFGLFFNFVKKYNSTYSTATLHFSLVLTISKAFSNEV